MIARKERCSMADTMMRLGDFKFSIDTAAYQNMTRSASYNWEAQQRVGNHEALQFTGFGEDSITLKGSVYPHWRGGTGQLQAMREMASEGKPLILVDGNGFVHGRWVITKVDERASTFAAGGSPLKQQFTLALRYYDDGSG
jgi:phage protein U